jgi:hypothetical protein
MSFSRLNPKKKIRKLKMGQSGGAGTKKPDSARRMNNVNKDLVTQDLIESIVFWQ